MTSPLKDTGCKPQAHGESAPGGGPCPRCDRPRCTAAAKSRPGERCRKNPHPGATICTNHGLTAAGRAKAQQNQLEAGADQALRKLWTGLDEATPIKDPVAAMERLAGSLESMVEAAGERVSKLQHLAGGKDLTQLRAEVVLLERALGHFRALLVDMARLGLAERQVELQQEQAQLVTQAFLGALAVLPGLLPADKDAAIRAYLTGLGRGPELLELEAGAAS